MTGGEGAPTAEPRVSVVMIFLNAGPYLAEAVASVLVQTVTDLQLVLVDDGSSDGSREAAQEWASLDSRVLALSHPGNVNRGMSASRTLGIERGCGRWVAFLDGDDVWELDHLERQLDQARRCPEAGIVISPTTVWVSWHGEGEDTVRDLPYPAERLLPAGRLLDSVTFAGTPIPTCGLMFLRSIIPPDGPGDREFRGLFEDQTMVARLTVRAPAVMAPDSTSRYRQHRTSAVHRSPGRGSRDPATLRYLSWIEDFLRAHGELTPKRASRLDEVRRGFEPRWAFWVWYVSRWVAMRVLPQRVQRLLRHRRPPGSGPATSSQDDLPIL